jgi:glutathione synthase/RimK-type ligase-like ATP-grasp enzyme
VDRNDRARIGITCPDDHPVFSVVGDALADRGHAVTYFDPTESIPEADLAALDLLAHKRTRPASVRALLAAERLGVRTWNSATGVVACVSRLSQSCLLAGVGFAVPATYREKPAGDYVAKALYHWDMGPEVNGEGDVYEELLPADPVDHKYYLVDDGERIRAVTLRATSKLRGEKRVLGETDPVDEHVRRAGILMDRLGMCALGVDVVRADGAWYAVDLNPCPSFEATGLEDALVNSILARLG